MTPITEQVTFNGPRSRSSVTALLYFGTLAALFYVFVLDGYVRLSTGSTNLTVLRDVIPFAVALLGLAFVATTTHRVPRIPLVGLVLLFAAVVLVQVANPYAVSPLEALVASRQHLEFVFLFFVGFALFGRTDRLRGVAVVIVVAGALNGTAGLAQVNLTANQLASWGPGYEALVAAGDGGQRSGRTFVNEAGVRRIRPPALGGDAGFGGVLGAFALPLALALALGAGSRRHQLLAIGAMPLAMAAVVTSQTRAAVLAAVVGVAAFLVLGAAGRRGAKILVGAVVASALTVLCFSLAFKGSVDLERFESIVPSRLFSTFEGERGSALTVLPDYIARYPFGAGLGSVGPAAGSRAASENTGELAGENLFVFLVVELGVAGLLLVLTLLVATLRRGVLASRRARDPAVGLLLAGITAGLFATAVLSFAGGITASPPGAPYFWLAIGIIGRWSWRANGLVDTETQSRHGTDAAKSHRDLVPA